MADPLWFGPPEAVAALLETSDPSTVVANIAAWLAEAVQHELSMGASVANIAATLEQWVGLGGAANVLKGGQLNVLGLQPLAAHCLKHVAIGHAAVEANILARSTIIPSAVVLENRAELAALHSTNFCGSNTPAITANEATYHGFYHPNNTRAGVVYAGMLNSLYGVMSSTPPPVTPTGLAPAEAAAPAETVAQSVTDDAGSGLTSAPAQLGQAAGPAASPTNELTSLLQPAQGLMTSGTQPVTELTKLPTQGFQSGASLLQNFMGMFPGSTANAGAVDAAAVGVAGGPLSAAGGLGAGIGSTSSGAVSAGYSGAGLTSFTRPASTFSSELVGGRAAGLKPANFLNAAELRGPTTTAPMGGGGMPMSPAAAGMLGRETAGAGKGKVSQARIVVNGDKQDPEPC